MRRHPATVLRECADLVPGTPAGNRLRGLIDISTQGMLTRSDLCDLLVSSSVLFCYCADGRAALALAAEEIAR